MNLAYAKELVDKILKEEPAAEYIENEMWEQKVSENSYIFLKYLRSIEGMPKCTKSLGATKMAILMGECDFVLKFPFKGIKIGNPFRGCYGENYCEDEAIIYNKFQKKDAGILLPETVYYKGVEIQEKVIPFQDTFYSFTKESQEMAKAAYEELENIDCVEWEWLAYLYDCFGYKDTLDMLSSFVTKLSPDFLVDLSMNNVGVRKDGTPCILDFAGYYE